MRLTPLFTTKNIPGFTLVELIVATALFISVITIAVGALFTAQSINARLQATHVILDGMSLSFELMSREIRYGNIFYCGNDSLPFPTAQVSLRNACAYDPVDLNAGGTVLVFRPVDAVSPDDRIGFYVLNGKLFKWSYIGGLLQPAKQVTSDELVIDTLHFFVTGANTTPQAVSNGNIENKAGTTDTFQPVVTAIITGSIFSHAAGNQPKHEIDFQLESTITARGLDI